MANKESRLNIYVSQPNSLYGTRYSAEADGFIKSFFDPFKITINKHLLGSIYTTDKIDEANIVIVLLSETNTVGRGVYTEYKRVIDSLSDSDKEIRLLYKRKSDDSWEFYHFTLQPKDQTDHWNNYAYVCKMVNDTESFLQLIHGSTYVLSKIKADSISNKEDYTLIL
jgi:hypothetical protein